jgi:hypothetical protein
VGVDAGQSLPGDIDLAAAEILNAEQYLTLLVAVLDDVEVDNPDSTDTGCRQVQTDRRAESTGADHQGGRRLEAFLSFRPYFRQGQVAAVARDFFPAQLGLWAVAFHPAPL